VKLIIINTITNKPTPSNKLAKKGLNLKNP